MGASWWRAIMLQANIFIGFLSLNLESILAQNNIRDPCTNECQRGDPYSWCGERRYDPAGQVVRCVQGSRYGQECVDSCSAKNEHYFWCWTNAHANGQSDYWEKCGTSKGDQSYTVKGGSLSDHLRDEGEHSIGQLLVVQGRRPRPGQLG